MRVALPKPIHGWRQLAGEVGIIVVGVLIALGAQQVVENRHWRNQVAEARASLDSQLIESKFASMERIAMSDCTDRQLNVLDDIVAGERPAGRLKVDIGALRLWSTSAWDAAISSGAVAHMPPDIRGHYAGLFSFTAALREINQREFDTVSDLKTLERHTDLTDVSRDRLAQDVAKLRAFNSILKLGAEQWLDGAKPLRLKLEGAELDLEKAKFCVMPDGSGGKSAPAAS